MLLSIGCSQGFNVTQFDPQSNNDERVTYYSHSMSISTPQAAYMHIATVAPHELNGNKLQATGFDKDGNYAYIVYNTEGNTVRGGLDIISVASLNTPVVVSSLVSENSEYAEVKRRNNHIFMVGQKKDTERNYGLLTVVDISNKTNPQVVGEVVFTDGWYATSIDIQGSKAYVTVPNVGVKTLDISNPLSVSVLSTQAAHGNSLFVRRNGSDNIVLGGTSTHKVSKLSGATVSSVYSISNQEQEAPARFIISGNTLLTNGGNTGLTILDKINTSSVTLKSQTPVTGRGNGITVGQCKTAYLAQGDQGLLTFDISSLTSPQNVGRFDFAEAQEDCGSANNVFYMKSGSNHYVFVSDGIGGVKIVKVSYNDPNCSCDEDDHNSEDHSGLLCKVYDLSSTKPSNLPNFSTLTPVGSFTTDILNVTAQTWSNSFPLFPALSPLRSMKEWYGVVCEGIWESQKSQQIKVYLGSDDGSKFYLDGNLEINHDGIHGPSTVSKSINVLKKDYPVKIEYYQGPKTEIQLELKFESSTDAKQYMSGFHH